MATEAETLSEIHLVTPITPGKREAREEKGEKMICEEIDKGVSAAAADVARRPRLPSDILH